MDTILKHVELEVKEKGERVGIQELRKHMACYIKGIDDASKTRARINMINEKDELESVLRECFL